MSGVEGRREKHRSAVVLTVEGALLTGSAAKDDDDDCLPLTRTKVARTNR